MKNPLRTLIPLALASLALPSLSPAADNDGNYAVWGVGSKSCYHFIQAQGQPEADAYRNFVTGFLTAYDAVSADTYNISSGKDLDQVMGWLVDYCSKRQIHSFEQGLMEYTVEQHPQRSRRAPMVPQR